MTSVPAAAAPGRPDAREAGVRWRCRHAGLRLALLACAGAAAPCASWAQSWAKEVRVDTTLTYNDNAALNETGSKRSDTVLSVRPGLRVDRVGPSLELHLDAAAELLTYAHHTQDDQALPTVRGNLS